MTRPERLTLTVLLATLVAVALLAGRADAREVQWHSTGASLFGGPGDASSGCTGYRGDNLCGWKWRSFAELGMGCNRPGDRGLLGNLPYGTRIRVVHAGRKLTLVKRDCGGGGGPVGGLPRGLDLWWKAAAYLRVHGLAVVRWRVVSPGGNR
jgi:hypothetical protein